MKLETVTPGVASENTEAIGVGTRWAVAARIFKSLFINLESCLALRGVVASCRNCKRERWLINRRHVKLGTMTRAPEGFRVG